MEPQIDKTYKLTFESDSDIEQIEIPSFENKNDAYSKARTKLMNKYNIQSKTEFEKEWNKKTSGVYISYSDKPWSTSEELIKELESLNSIKSAKFLPQDTTFINQPPQLYIQINKDAKVDTVEKEIINYYKGLIIDKKSENTIFITLDPSEFL